VVKNLDLWKKRLAKIPRAARAAAAAQLEKEADDLVAAIKRNVPVSQDSDPGTLRDSVRWEQHAEGKELSVTVIEDAKDGQGKGFAPFVEFGHHKKTGQYVPAQPHFFPTYRARKKGIRRRMQAATRKAVRAEYDK